MYKFLMVLILLLIMILACGEGTIPTAVDPLIELQAAYAKDRPVIDGVTDEVLWEQTKSYLVHIGERDLRTGQIVGGYNVEMKALWWREWGFSGAWGEQSYVAISLSWPDEDKNIEKDTWRYNPADTSWAREKIGSDWFIINWYSTGALTDLWYWDAALTNPMGYLEDQYIERFQVNDSTEIYRFNIDGLRYLNDISTQNNGWDINYNDNMTPRDSTDDFPMKIWQNDPQQAVPTLPRVYSSEDERMEFLLNQDAGFMQNAFTTPYAVLTEPVTVPGFMLEDPLNSSADIMAAGKYANGYWTVELVRACVTQDEGDTVFNPDSRYSSYYFSLIMGDKSHAPLEPTLDPESQQVLLQTANMVRLTFEFVTSATVDGM